MIFPASPFSGPETFHTDPTGRSAFNIREMSSLIPMDGIVCLNGRGDFSRGQGVTRTWCRYRNPTAAEPNPNVTSLSSQIVAEGVRTA
jgi:hypothetical protein